MSWGTVQDTVRAAVISALGVDAVLVQWVNSAGAAQWRQPLRVDLTLRTPKGVGVDEYRHTFDVGSDSLQHTLAGQRIFTVSVKIETDPPVAGLEGVETISTGTLAGRLRLRLMRKGVLADLQAAGVALSSIEPSIPADYPSDGRMVSASITDVVFLTSETEADATASGDYIQTVTGTRTIGGNSKPYSIPKE